MGRLFWKFFFAFWLTLLTAGIGVGTMVWLRHAAQENQYADLADSIDVRRASLVTLAASVVRHGGIDGLRDFMLTVQNTRFPPIYAVDATDQDLLHRPVAAEMLRQARALFLKSAYPDAVKMVSTDDGHGYLLFVPLPEQGFSDIFRPQLSGNLTPPFGLDGPPPESRPPLPGNDENRRPPRHREPPSPILPIISGSVASLLFSALLAWYFAKPIRSLRAAFAAVAQGRLDNRIGEAMGKRRDELADLGRDFDHMANQICSLVSAQQHLLHDVSHELRSPLARIQAAIGLAQQQPEKTASTLERIEHESQRMSDLVGELLILSRLEAGVVTAKIERIDIGDLLADIVDDVRFEAEHHSVTLVYSGIDSLLGSCQTELLHRAVENVLRNAIQHCKNEGTVFMTASYEHMAGRLHIRIEDQGPGVPTGDLAAIFQPFFRSGNHRKHQSTGLGLTIAQRAIDAHGGLIYANNRPEGGLRVDIEIPVANGQT